MASSTKSPGTLANDASVGTIAWVNASNAGASDDVRASCALTAGNTGQYLKATNFGFSIPAGATINGIQVDVERYSDDEFQADCEDFHVRMVKGGTISGDDKAEVGNWPASDTVKTFGGASDLWGLTWDHDDINSSTFGFVIAAQETNGKSDDTDAYIDHIQITITYTALVDNLPATSALPQNGSIVSRWKQNEQSGTRFDSVGSNDLTDNNTVLYSAAANFSTDAADYESANSEYLSHADNASLSITGDMTISGWFNIESAPSSGNDMIFVSKYNNTQRTFYFVYRNTSGTLKLGLYVSPNATGSGATTSTVDKDVGTATWVHLTVVYDASAGEVAFYVNGTQEGSTQTSAATSMVDGTADFRLGTLDAGSGPSYGLYDGMMQDTVLWNVELSSAEVTDLYDAYFASGFTPKTIII